MTLVSSAPQAVLPEAPADEVVVCLEHLKKRFPVRRTLRHTLLHPFNAQYAQVLQGISFEVRRGEFFGLLGPNGAGKTTLFKILATLILPDEGDATVAGYDLLRQPAAVRRALSPVIADERSLYWRLSAWENLRLYAVLQGLRGRVLEARIGEVLEVVGLEKVGSKMVGQYSSGMKQRLLIARALVARPQVLLLDEPTRSLDPISARRFRTFLRETILRDQGCTILLATHNTDEARDLCDRVAILDRGRLLALGTTEELSQEIGQEQYRIVTRAPYHSAFAALGTQAGIRCLGVDPADTDGWAPVRIAISGGPERAAEVLTFLTAQGVPVARFERQQLGLADLIEHVIDSANSEGLDG